MIIESWKLPGVLYTRYLDVVTGRELIDHALRQSGDARFDNLRYIIGDWSEVKKTEITTLHVKELMACLVPMSKLCPKAINASVVKRNNTGMGLAAWYRYLGEQISWRIDIFHTPEEAFENYKLDYSAVKLDAQLLSAAEMSAGVPKDIPPAKSQGQGGHS